MQKLGDKVYSLDYDKSDAENTQAMLDIASKVGAAPTVNQVEQLYDDLVMYGNLSDVHKRALEKVVGSQAGAGYQGGFLHGGGPLPWVNFSRELIALQLIVRIADYKYIQQKNHELCGPVTFMQGVARRDPVEYVNFVIGLATQRRGTIGNRKIKVRAGSALLHKQPNPNSIEEADYIALASLRDNANIFPYRSRFTSSATEGMTTPGEIVAWMRDAGFRNVEDHTHGGWPLAGMLMKAHRQAFAQRTMQQNVQTMDNRLTAGHTVIMCAAANLAHMALGQNTRTSGAHATLVKGVAVRQDGITFSIVTWGQEVTNRVTIPWSKLGSWYQGFVCGQP